MRLYGGFVVDERDDNLAGVRRWLLSNKHKRAVLDAGLGH